MLRLLPARRISLLILATVGCASDLVEPVPESLPLRVDVTVSDTLVGARAPVTVAVAVTNLADTVVIVRQVPTCVAAVMVVSGSDTLTPVFAEGPACVTEAGLVLGAGETQTLRRTWAAEVAAWPYGRYAPDGAATVALRAARVEVVGGPAGVTVRVPAQGRVEGTVTLDSVLLPWAPEDFGWFRAVLRNPTRDTLRVPMEVPPASQGCNVLVEIADPSGVVRVPWQGVTWTCLPSDTTVLTLPPADSTTWTFIWAGTVLRNDSAHPWPVGPAVPAGAWAAHVTVGPADDRYRVGTLAFPMGRPALDQLDRRVWVAQDSVAVGESVELRIGLYNTTDRLLRIWEGDLECVLGVLMVREADGQDVTPSYICFGSSRWRVLQPGDSLVSGGPDWSWEFRATGTRSVPGRYALRYRLGYPSDPPAYLGAPIFVTVY